MTRAHHSLLTIRDTFCSFFSLSFFSFFFFFPFKLLMGFLDKGIGRERGAAKVGNLAIEGSDPSTHKGHLTRSCF